MRIVIDMQGVQTESRFRGIGRYTMALAQAIVRNKGEHEVILVLNGLLREAIEPIRAAFDDLMPQENICVWYAPGPVRACEVNNGWRRDAAECIREVFIASLHPDVVYVSSLFEGYIDDAVTSIGVLGQSIPTAVTLYDLIPLLNPDKYLTPNSKYAQYYQRKIDYLKQASLWLAISAAAADEGINNLGLAKGAVNYVSTACDPIFHRMEISASRKKDSLTRFGITKPFVLYSGGADARKNLVRLIRAFANLPNLLCERYQLVMAGKMPEANVVELEREAKSAGLHKDSILFTNYVSDEQLAELYNLCTVFILPSLHEGFGLPALEAMSCGAAVIGSNISSVPEVIGREDALFNPYDEKSISSKLAQVLEDNAFRNELITHGIEQARKFNWDACAQRAIAAFEGLHASRVNRGEAVKTASIVTNLINKLVKLIPPETSNKELLKYAYALNRIYSNDDSHKLFVDISELVHRDARTGVQRVTRSILQELLKCPPEGWVVEPVYAATDNTGYRYARHFIAQLGLRLSDLDDEPIEYRSGDIFLGLDLQHHVVNAQQEYLRSIRLDGVKVFFVIYDLLPIQMPWAFMPGADIAHAGWLEIISSLDGAVCISHAVANELADWLKKHGSERSRPFKIGSFHLGADLENSNPTSGLPDNAPQVLQTLAGRKTFLMVGTVEPRKGHVQTLSAFEILWERGIDMNLVIVGKKGWMVDGLAKKIAHHPERNKHLFWLESVSDEYLEKVYAASTCLIAASEGEGFGLPLIEAAQKKLPIIARDIPVFREVAGPYAYYFRAGNPEELATAIGEWLALYEKEKHPKSDAMPWLTWKKSASQLLNAMGVQQDCAMNLSADKTINSEGLVASYPISN